MGVACVIAVAIAGIGWHREGRPGRRPPARERVFADVEALVREHPAWEQVAGIGALKSSWRSAGAPGVGAGPAAAALPGVRDPQVKTEARSALESRLERKAQDELSNLMPELLTSLDRRLAERRRELEAQALAVGADAARRSEQELSRSLRALDEQHQSERVDCAVKLAALRAQLSSPAGDVEAVKAAIAAREKELGGLDAKLGRDKQELGERAEASLLQEKDRRLKAIEDELGAMREQESRRIEAAIQARKTRLERDLDGRGTGGLQTDRVEPFELSGIGAGAGSRAAKVRSLARSRFTGGADGSARDLAELAQALRKRIRAELRAVVTRIAADNGLAVAFEPERGVPDRTEWFRQRLPYRAGREAG